MKISRLFNGIARILLIIGGINWGLVGVFNYNLVIKLTGDATSFSTQIIYALVGLAAIYEAVMSISR